VCVCSIRYPACSAHGLYYTVICGLPVSKQILHIIGQTARSGKKKFIEHKMCVLILGKKEFPDTECVFGFSLQLLSETFLILTRKERDMIKNPHRSSCKEYIILAKL